MTGRFPLAENFRETGFFIPAALNDADQTAVLTLASLAIEALGVTTGCLHSEIKFTPDGPRVIEVNGRVGGGVPEMLDRAAGVALLELTLRLALGEPIRIDGPVATKRIGYRFFLQPPSVSATVATINGIDAVSDYPGVDTISVHQGPGAILDWKDGSRNHIVAVVGVSTTMTSCNVNRIRRKLGYRHVRRHKPQRVSVRLVKASAPGGSPAARRGESPFLTCAFVNNMPDGAFDATERQYLGLIEEGSTTTDIEVRRYTVPGVPRGRTDVSADC